MKKLFYAVILVAVLMLAPGCKISQSALRGVDEITVHVKEAKEVCDPLLDAAIEVAKKQFDAAETPEEHMKYYKLVSKLLDIKKNFPKIIRNLEQLKSLLEAFNGVSSDDKLPEKDGNVPIN
jgi:hypothetical protein